jgi:hypothetical protein
MPLGFAQEVAGLTAWAATASPIFFQHTHHIVHSINAAVDERAPIDADLRAEMIALADDSGFSEPTPMPVDPLSPFDHVIYTDASSRFQAVSIVRKDAVHAHASALLGTSPLWPVPKEPRALLSLYHSQVADTFISLAPPDLQICSTEADALTDAIDIADSRGLLRTLFATDNDPLFGAVCKGRSNNPEMHRAARAFAELKQRGLQHDICWVPTAANYADVPTRPELLPAGTSHPLLDPASSLPWTPF